MVMICIPQCLSELNLKVPTFLRWRLGLVKIDVSRIFDFLSCLSEEVKTGTVLPLRYFNTDILRRNPGSQYAAVVISDQCYCNPNPYVAPRSRVGLFPLCRKAAGYEFKRSLRLHVDEAVHRYNEGG